MTRNQLYGAGLSLALGLGHCTRSPPPPTAATGHQPSCPQHVPETPTFTRDIAPLLWHHCSVCHRPGQSAPFALLDYEDAFDHAEQIADLCGDRYMPPWRAVPEGTPGHVAFSNARSLTPIEIATLRRWSDLGAPKGTQNPAQRAPSFSSDWQLGPPDLILRADRVYTLPAEGQDIYRNFVLPSTLTEGRWVRAWEFRPSNPRVIHHAIVNLDTSGWAARQAAAEPEPGFDGMGSQATQSPGDSYLVWAPGSRALENPPDIAWRLPKAADLVLQLHLQPTGKPEAVHPEIGLYFQTHAPKLRSYVIRVGDVNIDIPAGEANHWIEDRYTVPVSGRVFAAFPHAHYLAREIQARVISPEGEQRWLLHIQDWDFDWQDEYRYADPPRVSAGSVIELKIRYDNSPENPANPRHTPVRVRAGFRSLDEMGNLSLQFVPDNQGAIAALKEHHYRRELARSPSARHHYNLGNIALRRGDPEAARQAYLEALKLNGRHFHSLHNLSVALEALGDRRAALAYAHKAKQVDPASPRARARWLQLAIAEGDLDAAIVELKARTSGAEASIEDFLQLAQLQRVQKLDNEILHTLRLATERFPDSFQGCVLHAQVLANLGRWQEALAEFNRAQQMRPGDTQLTNIIEKLRRRSPTKPETTVPSTRQAP